MNMWRKNKNLFRFCGFLLIGLILFSNLPTKVLLEKLVSHIKDANVVDVMYKSLKDKNVIDKGIKSLFGSGSGKAQASSFNIQTGYFVGNGGAKQITGLGFSPQMIILKSNSTGGAGAVFKTTAMPNLNTAYLGPATADTSATIMLDKDGFTAIGTNGNVANDRFTWIAFSGSNCSASGNFCVGSYVGNGTSPRAITTGFQPDMVMVKSATAVAANWRSSAMTTNVGQYFMNTNQDTTGALYTSLNSDGFTVGATNNTSATVYYYVAFKNTAGAINVGSYSGSGTAKNVTGVGFLPNFVLTKNSTATTAVSGVYNVTESYGNNSSYFTDTANVVGGVTELNSDGFGVGTNATVNSSGVTYFYAAFGGASKTPSSSGTFQISRGSYTGTGITKTIDDLGFVPDLVIIKGDTAQAGVFRTRMMAGDSSAYLDSATANLTGAITTLNQDGFVVGTSATTNSSGVTYYWTAYGNAWKPETNSGSSDFYIGAYYGNGIDNVNITGLPFQADMLTVKRSGATGGTFRTSSHSGDSSSFFAATADTSNNIQTISTNGFQIGTSANVNTAANIYWYFGFKSGTNFAVGTYSGSGSAKDVSTVGFQADNLWVKQTGATRGVFRHSSMSTANSIPFINVAGIAGAVTAFTSNGFSVGTGAEVNTSGTNNYRYVAWRANTTVGSSSFNIQTGYFVGNGGAKQITGLGFSPQMIILKSNSTGGAGAVFKTTAMPNLNTAYLGPATADTSATIMLDKDGFTAIGTNGNVANDRFTWIAFSGSNCSASGNFCVGSYVGNGTSPRAITTGFQPDMVMVKSATAVAANWRSSAMTTNVGQYFMNTNQDTTGALYTSLNSDGFTVGATNNTSATVYYYVAFKNTAGAINVGSYSGSGTAKNVTGVGFLPNFVLTKNSTATTAVSGVYNVTESYGNNSSYFTDTANVVGGVTELNSDGFGVGTNATVNSSGVTYFYAAFGGASKTPSSSGTFQISRGSYTGTGITKTIDDLGFVPDLVIIKGDTAQAGVFRTRMMAGDSSAYLDSATANLTGAITTLNQDGFVVGTSATTNSSGVTYYWTAYGNAWKPETNSGSSDFYIGAYYGNGIDNVNITGLPFQADMLTVKRSGATGGTFRTSSHSGDSSSFFAATADTSNNIQTISTNGFQIGTSANVNTAANIYWYFGFKSGTNFAVGTYSGSGSAKDVSTVGFQADNLWVKQTGATRGVFRHSSMSTANSIPFINVAGIAGAVTAFTSNGFSVGTGAEVNTSGTNNYRYVAWRTPDNSVLTVSGNGSQTATYSYPSADAYLGGAFVFERSSGAANITSIKITETGTINANASLTNVRLLYEDGPTCNYNGNETEFGSSASFSSESATITGTMPVGTDEVCAYVVVSILANANAGDTVSFRISQTSDVQVSSGTVSGSFPISFGETTLSGGSLAVDIVDDTGISVSTPSVSMSTVPFSFVWQTTSGSLGASSQKIRISNDSGNNLWTLSVAPTSGTNSLWTSAAGSYDFNDNQSGASDGPDGDNFGGQLTVRPQLANVTPKNGCNNNGLSVGSEASYIEGSVDSITLASTNSSAAIGCYWDLTNIGLSQSIPSQQPTSNYSLNITITITAN